MGSEYHNMNVLDIDLDLFLIERHRGPIVRNERSCSRHFHPWASNDVRRFLQANCGLRGEQRIPGKFGERHEHVYFELGRLREQTLGMTFDLVHIDAHADLGMGTVGCEPPLEFICTQLLHASPTDRPKRIPHAVVAEWNWVLFAVANRWLHSLTYVHHICGLGNDYPLPLGNWCEAPGTLRLAVASPAEYRATADDRGLGLTRFEPSIPFVRVPADRFESSGKYERAFLTRSPEYTPPEADDLLSVFKEFIDFKEP